MATPNVTICPLYLPTYQVDLKICNIIIITNLGSYRDGLIDRQARD